MDKPFNLDENYSFSLDKRLSINDTEQDINSKSFIARLG